MCGSRSAPALRAMHLLSVLHRTERDGHADGQARSAAATVARIYVLALTASRGTASRGTASVTPSTSISAPGSAGGGSVQAGTPAVVINAEADTSYEPPRSHLLDILIETSGRSSADARDKIFGVLSIANLLDERVEASQPQPGGRDKPKSPSKHARPAALAPGLKADYTLTVAQVYMRYSSHFIQQHGAGFFLALKKTQYRVQARQPWAEDGPDVELVGLSSWAADWTLPWPNFRALGCRDLVGVGRGAGVEGQVWGSGKGEEPGSEIGEELQEWPEGAVRIMQDRGFEILVIRRRRVLRGYFTRTGHVDDDVVVGPEDVKDLREEEVLVEVYPGLALLLVREGDCYVFVQVCPHALSKSGVEEVVARWSSLVIDGPGATASEITPSSGARTYLNELETFRIR